MACDKSFCYAVRKEFSGETVALFCEVEMAVEYCRFQSLFGKSGISGYEVWRRNLNPSDFDSFDEGSLVYTSDEL